MIALSIYSGECDGLGYAAEMVGIEVSAYCEADPKRRQRLKEKHPGKPVFESDTELTKDALCAAGIHPDIIFGGPPCQPYSVAGTKRGEADPRHRWPEMLRVIQECRPRWVLVENVGNFVNMALDLVLSDLEAEGYEAGAVVLPALAVGAPHRRDRCFVVGYAERSGQAGDDRGRTSEEPSGRCGESVGDSPSIRGNSRSMPWRNAKEQPLLDGRDQFDFFRAAQSRLGGVLDGVSHRLDEQMIRWPAWRGQEQHQWEPPRTGQGIKERPRRIESLGLAVVPWQVYPLLALLKELDDIMREVTP